MLAILVHCLDDTFMPAWSQSQCLYDPPSLSGADQCFLLLMVFPNYCSVICNSSNCLILFFIFSLIFYIYVRWVFHSHLLICLPRISQIYLSLVLVLCMLISNLFSWKRFSDIFFEDAIIFHDITFLFIYSLHFHNLSP